MKKFYIVLIIFFLFFLRSCEAVPVVKSFTPKTIVYSYGWDYVGTVYFSAPYTGSFTYRVKIPQIGYNKIVDPYIINSDHEEIWIDTDKRYNILEATVTVIVGDFNQTFKVKIEPSVPEGVNPINVTKPPQLKETFGHVIKSPLGSGLYTSYEVDMEYQNLGKAYQDVYLELALPSYESSGSVWNGWIENYNIEAKPNSVNPLKFKTVILVPEEQWHVCPIKNITVNYTLKYSVYDQNFPQPNQIILGRADLGSTIVNLIYDDLPECYFMLNVNTTPYKKCPVFYVETDGSKSMFCDPIFMSCGLGFKEDTYKVYAIEKCNDFRFDKWDICSTKECMVNLDKDKLITAYYVYDPNFVGSTHTLTVKSDSISVPVKIWKCPSPVLISEGNTSFMKSLEENCYIISVPNVFNGYYFKTWKDSSYESNNRTLWLVDDNTITAEYTTEPNQCNDKIDNDNDGKIDYPSDAGCTDATDNDETDAIQPSKTLFLKTGWNMFSPHVNTTINANDLKTRCGTTAKIWNYQNGRYVEATEIKPGLGYWIKLSSDYNLDLKGGGASVNDFPQLKAGWNQLGGLSSSATFDGIRGDCVKTAGPWKYNPSSRRYESANVLEPGYGYWVKVKSDCTLKETPKTCGNTFCDSGETQSNCCMDCGCPSGQSCVNNACQVIETCGNGYCGSGENQNNCCKDCGCPSGQSCVNNFCEQKTCGNTFCDSGETQSNCCMDCGCPSGQSCVNNACQVIETCGGNTFCDSGETRYNCCKDCGCQPGMACINNFCELLDPCSNIEIVGLNSPYIPTSIYIPLYSEQGTSLQSLAKNWTIEPQNGNVSFEYGIKEHPLDPPWDWLPQEEKDAIKLSYIYHDYVFGHPESVFDKPMITLKINRSMLYSKDWEQDCWNFSYICKNGTILTIHPQRVTIHLSYDRLYGVRVNGADEPSYLPFAVMRIEYPNGQDLDEWGLGQNDDESHINYAGYPRFRWERVGKNINGIEYISTTLINPPPLIYDDFQIRFAIDPVQLDKSWTKNYEEISVFLGNYFLMYPTIWDSLPKLPDGSELLVWITNVGVSALCEYK
jgi:hypothetical protein